MATHSGVLAWRIPGTGEPGGLRLWDRTESDMTEVDLAAAASESVKHFLNLVTDKCLDKIRKHG